VPERGAFRSVPITRELPGHRHPCRHVGTERLGTLHPPLTPSFAYTIGPGWRPGGPTVMTTSPPGTRTMMRGDSKPTGRHAPRCRHRDRAVLPPPLVPSIGTAVAVVSIRPCRTLERRHSPSSHRPRTSRWRAADMSRSCPVPGSRRSSVRSSSRWSHPAPPDIGSPAPRRRWRPRPTSGLRHPLAQRERAVASAGALNL